MKRHATHEAHVVALDLDGTLLCDDKTVSEFTIATWSGTGLSPVSSGSPYWAFGNAAALPRTTASACFRRLMASLEGSPIGAMVIFFRSSCL